MNDDIELMLCATSTYTIGFDAQQIEAMRPANARSPADCITLEHLIGQPASTQAYPLCLVTKNPNTPNILTHRNMQLYRAPIHHIHALPPLLIHYRSIQGWVGVAEYQSSLILLIDLDKITASQFR
jgi:hypothetical protein